MISVCEDMQRGGAEGSDLICFLPDNYSHLSCTITIVMNQQFQNPKAIHGGRIEDPDTRVA